MPSTWPLWLRRLMQETTIYFTQCYELVRQRTLGDPSSFKRLMAQRDEVILDAKLYRREINVLRQSRESIPHQKRPDYSPENRFEILQIMRLRQWSLRETAKHFAIHYNTVWAWSRAWRKQENVGLFFGSVPWNKLSDGVRWAVHQLRELIVEREFGTRRIAMHLIRSGIRISRSSVQRFLRKKKPPAPPVPIQKAPETLRPNLILRPKRIDRTWHLDMTTLKFPFIRFYVAAILDGFSRKILSLKVFHDAPSTAMILHLLRNAIGESGSPKFLVTDHGCQFRHRFKKAVTEKFNIKLVKGRVHTYYMNGKVERFFRTFNWWKRLTLFYPARRSIQKKLDIYKDYYNTKRPQWNLAARTPNEVWNSIKLPEPVPIRERDAIKPAISITETFFKGDPLLPVPEIEVIREVKQAA